MSLYNSFIKESTIYKKKIHCLQCSKTPLIYLQYIDNEPIICYKCQEEHKGKIPLSLFLENSQNFKNDINCARCGQLLEETCFYCINCQMITCEKCKDIHDKEKNHNSLESYVENENLCSVHSTSFFAYCLKCKKNICTYCKSHLEHDKFIFFDNFLKKNQLEKFTFLIDNAKNFINKLSEIQNKIKNFYSNQIIICDKIFNTFKKINEEEIKLCELLFDNYLYRFETHSITYPIIKNIENIFRFKYDNSTINYSLNSITCEKILNYFNNISNSILIGNENLTEFEGIKITKNLCENIVRNNHEIKNKKFDIEKKKNIELENKYIKREINKKKFESENEIKNFRKFENERKYGTERINYRKQNDKKNIKREIIGNQNEKTIIERENGKKSFSNDKIKKKIFEREKKNFERELKKNNLEIIDKSDFDDKNSIITILENEDKSSLEIENNKLKIEIENNNERKNNRKIYQNEIINKIDSDLKNFTSFERETNKLCSDNESSFDSKENKNYFERENHEQFFKKEDYNNNEVNENNKFENKNIISKYNIINNEESKKEIENIIKKEKENEKEKEKKIINEKHKENKNIYIESDNEEVKEIIVEIKKEKKELPNKNLHSNYIKQLSSISPISIKNDNNFLKIQNDESKLFIENCLKMISPEKKNITEEKESIKNLNVENSIITENSNSISEELRNYQLMNKKTVEKIKNENKLYQKTLLSSLKEEEKIQSNISILIQSVSDIETQVLSSEYNNKSNKTIKNTISSEIKIQKKEMNEGYLLKKYNELIQKLPPLDYDLKIETMFVKESKNDRYFGEISGKKKFGRGIWFVDGGLYEGYFYNDEANGYGKYTNSYGDVFQGEWENSKKKKGKEIFYNGEVFEGEYKNDHFFFGSFKDINGHVYEGQFKNNKKNGKGVLTVKKNNESIIYEGEWANGKLNGNCVIKYSSGNIDEVFFENGILSRKKKKYDSSTKTWTEIN